MACPVCNSSEIKQVYSGKDRVLSKLLPDFKGDLFLFKCGNCKMIFLDKLDYDSGQIHEAYWKMLAETIGNEEAPESRDRMGLLLDDLNTYIKNGKMLEVGCGDARFLKQAKDSGWEVTGIELSERAASLARKNYGIEVMNCPFREACGLLKGKVFDVIIMWGVVEHLKSPIEALRQAKSLLKKGGLLIIFTPNADSIFHRLARITCFFTAGIIKFPMERVITSMHLLYFTPGTLRRLINKCCFSVRKVEMSDINLDFIFAAHRNFRWSNKITLCFAKLLQRLSHLNSMHSHMVIFAEAI